MLVIHHNKDLDGFSSGAIMKLKYPDSRLFGWDYTDPVPWGIIKDNEEVIMIDISFPMDDMIKLLNITNDKLTIIDHHVSFKKDFDTYEDDNKLKINYIYQEGIAACELGWKWAFPEDAMPEAIKLLGEYDTWRQGDIERWNTQILPFQYYMRTVCVSVETFPYECLHVVGQWQFIANGCISGKAILTYQEQQDFLACKRSAFIQEFKGLRAICLNTRFFSSNTLKSIYNPDLHDIMVGFEYNGKVWAVSLRSAKPEIDVSLIAKSKGGGGHKAAAGYESSSFENIFI